MSCQSVCLHYLLLLPLAGECVAQDMVKNALHSMCNMKVTECYDIASEKMISLTDAYNSEQSLNEINTRLGSYRPL